MDMIAERLDSAKGEAWYSSVDLTYSYRQVPLHALTARPCNFQIIGGESTCTYRFETCFYGLEVMPTELQKVMDNLSGRFREAFVFIDDILIVTKGTKSEHMAKVWEILNTLDAANLQKAEQCKSAQSQIEWLGFKLNNSKVSLVSNKVQGITERLRPTNSKGLRSYVGDVNQINEFIPNLAAECFPPKNILKKDAEWKYLQDHEKAFERINNQVKNVVELIHLKTLSVTNCLRCEQTRASRSFTTKRRE